MRRLVSIIVCLAFLVTIRADGVEQQSGQGIGDQQKQAVEIERYISRLRRATERYYDAQIHEVQYTIQEQIRHLEVAENAPYAPLAIQADIADKVLQIDSCGQRAPWQLQAKTRAMLAVDGGSRLSPLRRRSKEAPARFAAAHSLIARKKSNAIARGYWELLCLERQKEYALTVRLAELQRWLRESPAAIKEEPAQSVVTGVLYTADKPAATINGKVVHKGDIIDGVSVLNINADGVEFAKGGERWRQKVGEAAGPLWQ